MIDEERERARRTESRASHGGAGDARPSDVAVLHVEPDPQLRNLLSAFLRRGPGDVALCSVERVADALTLVDDADCVVTEHRLPDGTGIDLFNRTRERGCQTPFLIHTACCDPSVENRAFEAGVAAYVKKRPVRGQYGRLLEAIHDQLDAADSENGTRTRATAGSERIGPPSTPSPSEE